MKNFAFFASGTAAAILVAVSAVKAQIVFPDGSQQSTAAATSVAGVDFRGATVIGPPAGSTITLFNVSGSGSFLSALVSQDGGANGFTFVRVFVDGEEIENRSFAGLLESGVTQPNPTGTVLLAAGIDTDARTVAVGLPYPIRFEQSLVVQAQLGLSNTGVTSVSGRLLIAQ